MPIWLKQFIDEAPLRNLKHAQEMERRRIAEEKKKLEFPDNVGVPRRSRFRLPEGFVEGGD